MKKEIFNILFLGVVVAAVAWLYWPREQATGRHGPIGYKSYIIALSWQPAFCEGKPNKPECRSQHARRYDANNFSLHGLWPQPRDNVYCGVPKKLIEMDKRGRWHELPKLDMQSSVRKELSKIMPGYRSNLHRHEWYKHGTCMDIEAQEYYKLSIGLIGRVNQTGLSSLFAKNINKEITAAQVAKVMDQSFGKGAGNRIKINCKRDGKRTLISGLHISIANETEMRNIPKKNAFILNAPKLPIGCKRGIVDPVGLQ